MAAPPCAVCAENAAPASLPHGGVLYEDATWLLHHAAPAAPVGVAGWLTLQTKAHVGGAADFDRATAASFGPLLAAACAALRAASGAPRVYVAALGEAHAHFHCHLVPRDEGAVRGWGLFSVPGDVAAGRAPPADAARAAAIAAAVKAALAGYAPPRAD